MQCCGLRAQWAAPHRQRLPGALCGGVRENGTRLERRHFMQSSYPTAGAPAGWWATHRSVRAPHGRTPPALDARAALQAQGGRREHSS